MQNDPLPRQAQFAELTRQTGLPERALTIWDDVHKEYVHWDQDTGEVYTLGWPVTKR